MYFQFLALFIHILSMSESAVEAKPMPDGYLVLSNISKNHNIGNMVRSACAFGMKEVVVRCSCQH